MIVRCLFLIMLLSGCAKVELDPATLNDNPFDPGYVGGSVFAITGHEYFTVILGSEEVQRARVRFVIDRSAFNADGFYRVRIKRVGDNGYSYVQHTELGDGTFEVVALDPEPGVAQCWELALGNGDDFPNVFDHCYTFP